MSRKIVLGGQKYETLHEEWLPKFIAEHRARIETVCMPFVDAKGQDWSEFLDFVVAKDYVCDEVGLFLFAQMYHIHVRLC